MSLEHEFSDCAYAGMQPGNISAVSLAFLGVASVASDIGYSFSDSAYLGLQPGRATPLLSAYIGFAVKAQVPIELPTNVEIYRPAWSNYPVQTRVRIPAPRLEEVQEETLDESESELVVAMYYFGAINGWENIFLDPR